MYAEQNEPSVNSTVAFGSTASGSKSTETMRPTLLILSPAAFDRAAHAQYLRDRYGIPVLMAPDDGLDD